MKRANRRRVPVCRRLLTPLLLLLLVVAAPLAVSAQEKPGAKKRPHSDSRTPFVHRIQVRDAQDNPIQVPREPTKDGKPPHIPLMAINTTCGKCHDYPTISTGWHFNMADPHGPAGRPGEPWILTDEGVLDDAKTPALNTRTQLPISYRKWPGTWTPQQVGSSDWKFAYAFARQHPGGGILETSKDQRFNVTGHLANDCLVCHLADNSYDLQARYEQITKKQNFKYATLVAAGVGSAERSREKLKDTWTPPDPKNPKAEGPSEPPFEYDMSRFNPEGQITFDVTRRVPNERCYSCHTSLDTGLPGGNGLAQRWRHDGDIHLVKGMLCVDCHKHGLDHMITRNYEKEAEHRHDPSITTLTCQGCHYGASGPTGEGSTRQPTSAAPTTQPLAGGALDLGGRNAAPRPQHKGLPTLHFDKLSCTACHSGPYPSTEATRVLTSMAHRLGTESYNRAPDAAPAIQQPVFLRDPETHKITPHKVLYPTFWARMNGSEITPISPDLLSSSKVLQKVLGYKPTLDLQPAKPLKEEEIAKALDAIAAMQPPKATASAAATTKPTTGATTAPATAPQPWYTGEPVFITGGKAYKRAGSGKVTAFDHDAAKPYAWALAHDVRGAQQALGAKGCTDCHATGAPVFDSKVLPPTLLASATVVPVTMSQLRGDSTGALAAFAATYPLRPMLIATGYTCAVILGLLLIAYAGRAITAVGRRRVP
jgi:hypothetical protein